LTFRNQNQIIFIRQNDFSPQTKKMSEIPGTRLSLIGSHNFPSFENNYTLLDEE
jgi:hypothetical protein